MEQLTCSGGLSPVSRPQARGPGHIPLGLPHVCRTRFPRALRVPSRASVPYKARWLTVSSSATSYRSTLSSCRTAAGTRSAAFTDEVGTIRA